MNFNLNKYAEQLDSAFKAARASYKKPKAISAMQKNGDAKPNTLKKSL